MWRRFRTVKPDRTIYFYYHELHLLLVTQIHSADFKGGGLWHAIVFSFGKDRHEEFQTEEEGRLRVEQQVKEIYG